MVYLLNLIFSLVILDNRHISLKGIILSRVGVYFNLFLLCFLLFQLLGNSLLFFLFLLHFDQREFLVDVTLEFLDGFGGEFVDAYFEFVSSQFCILGYFLVYFHKLGLIQHFDVCH